MNRADSKSLRKVGGLFGLALSGVILFDAICTWDRPSSAENTVTLRDDPHKVFPLVQPIFSRESPEACLTDSLLGQSASFPLVGPSLCHLLRIYGLEVMPHHSFNSGIDIVRILTDHELAAKHLGQSIQFQTRHGIRYKLPQVIGLSNQDGESHRDIFLATFGELGLPLSTPIHTATGSFTLRELLKDSIAHFRLKQKEIAWTAIAYSLYLPPQREWSNRDEESFTFDGLASELLQRPLKGESCGGTHLIEAMTLLARVDLKTPVLSSSVREAIRRNLQAYISAAIESQADEGYWTSGWDQTETRNDSTSVKLIITGHLLEVMEYLPQDLQPDAEVYRRAADWLCSELSQNLLKPSQFCPWTHAYCSIRNLVGDINESAANQSSIVLATFEKGD